LGRERTGDGCSPSRICDSDFGLPQQPAGWNPVEDWDDIFIIRDCKSRNGTFLNGQPIKVAQLDAGDVIKIGNSELKVMAESGSKTEVTMQP
jgi:pSer/pThr/pTyr-binding forkhead associated (FHA) protein